MERQRLDIWNDLLSHKNRFLFDRGDVSDLSLLNFTATTKAGIVICVKGGKSTLKLHIQWRKPLLSVQSANSDEGQFESWLWSQIYAKLWLQGQFTPLSSEESESSTRFLCRTAENKIMQAVVSQTGKVLTAEDEGRMTCPEKLLRLTVMLCPSEIIQVRSFIGLFLYVFLKTPNISSGSFFVSRQPVFNSSLQLKWNMLHIIVIFWQWPENFNLIFHNHSVS